MNQVLAGKFIFVIFFCSMNRSDMMIVAWMLSIAFIILFF